MPMSGFCSGEPTAPGAGSVEKMFADASQLLTEP